jgi:hypothetical protein
MSPSTLSRYYGNATTHCHTTVTVTLLWKRYKLTVMPQALLRYYGNALQDLPCHNIYIYIYIYIYSLYLMNAQIKNVFCPNCVITKKLPSPFLTTSSMETSSPKHVVDNNFFHHLFFFSLKVGVGQTQAWMPTYVSILRIPHMIRVWRATMEWYWQGKTEELGEKPVPAPLCPPQIPHGLTRAQTRASAVRGRRLTTWAMARPPLLTTWHLIPSFISFFFWTTYLLSTGYNPAPLFNESSSSHPCRHLSNPSTHIHP